MQVNSRNIGLSRTWAFFVDLGLTSPADYSNIEVTDVTVTDSNLLVPALNKFYVSYYNALEKCLAFIYADSFVTFVNGSVGSSTINHNKYECLNFNTLD